MNDRDETIRVLRATLEASPENVTLRRHLADLLRAAGRLEEAADEYRKALRYQPEDAGLKLALADAWYQFGDDSRAAVVLDSLFASGDAPAAAHMLLARVRLREGNTEGAVAAYQRALDLDPASADRELSERLGVPMPGEEDSQADVSRGRMRAGGGPARPARADDDDTSEAATGQRVERPRIRFEDVGGMDALKEEIDLKIIQPLKQPDLFRAYGKAIGGGILLYGPPGCGKTYLARATAGQVEASFMAVGLNEVLSMWIGESERNLHKLFERARDNTPFVLFFDEVDALGANRTDLKNSGMRMVINQLLEEMDGARGSNEGVLILAATNAPWHLDPALRRPGRFDRVLFVPPPDAAARAAIVGLHLRGKPVADVDVEKIAAKSDGMSGADLKAVIDLAVEDKLREALKKGKPQPITTKDLLDAAKRVRPSTKEWFATARNYVLYSNEGGLYDDVARYMKL